MKYLYTWAEYKEDIGVMVKHLKNKSKNIHLVSIYRGSLGIGAHLSNLLDAPLSIVKFQSYNGDDKTVEMIYNAGISSADQIVILDDLIDQGTTMNMVHRYFKDRFPQTSVESWTLFGRKDNNPVGNSYVHEHPGKWIVTGKRSLKYL